jgi:hypothetical protein
MKAIFRALVAKLKAIFKGDKEKAIVDLHKLEGELRDKVVKEVEKL